MSESAPLCSVVELGKHGDSTFGPVSWSVASLDWKTDLKHEVGRVTSGSQSTETSQGLVDWTRVGVSDWHFGLLSWLQPDSWHLSEENLIDRLLKDSLLLIPSTTLNEKTIDVSSILWWGLGVHLLFINDFEVKFNTIDSDSVLSSEVLLNSSEETLGEEES